MKTTSTFFKLILAITLILGVSYSTVQASTLWDYYQGNLPSISERSDTYHKYFADDYKGTAEQNVRFLNQLTLSQTEPVLGAVLPQAAAVFETSLQSPITSSATSMTLTANAVRGGGVLSGYNCFTIDEGSAQSEFTCGTVSGTAVSSLTRGVSPLTGTTTIAALQFAHRRGANVKITDFPLVQILKAQANGEDTYPNKLTYTTHPTFTNGTDLIDKTYADANANQGAATSTESNGGIVELGTIAEQASSFDGGILKPTVLQTKNSTSTCQTIGSYTIVASTTTGKLDKGCLDQTLNYTLSGSNTLSGTTTISANNSNKLILNTINYSFPSATGTANQTLSTTATGILSWATTTPLIYATSTTAVYLSNASFVAASSTIPGGTLSTNRVIHGKFFVQWRSVSTTAKTINIVYGGTACASSSGTPDANTDTTVSGILDFYIVAAGATNSQICSMSYVASTGGGIFKTSTVTGVAIISGAGSAAIDSTTDKRFELLISQANNANESFQVSSGYIELLK